MPYPYKSFREWFADEEKLGNVVRLKTPIKRGDYKSIRSPSQTRYLATKV